MAVSLFFYYCCPLNLMDQKKIGQKWFKEQWKHILNQNLSD